MTARAYIPQSQREDWETPQAFFDALNAEFGFTLDVAASADNAKCARYFTEEIDGLSQDWGSDVCWMNPPYGRVIADWMRKALEASRGGGGNGGMPRSRTNGYGVVARMRSTSERAPLRERAIEVCWRDSGRSVPLSRDRVPPTTAINPRSLGTYGERDKWVTRRNARGATKGNRIAIT